MTVWLSLGLVQSAHAGCDKELKALGAAQGAAVATAFQTLSTCDRKAAEEAFAPSIKRTGDVDSLAALVRFAIDAGLTSQAQGALELVPDFAAREETARLLGGWCTEDAAIATFLVGLDDALKDRAFVGWSGALRTCDAPALLEDLEAAAGAPPAQAFDDKYATIIDLYASKRRAAALPVLETAAGKAASGGPFSNIVDAMVKSVTPDGIGTSPSDADKAALVAALGRIGEGIEPAAVREIADALVGIGDMAAAGKLLPKLYPDRVQEGGVFLYGLAAVESCNDKSMVHYVVVEDRASRWAITSDAEAQAKIFKPKLKCEAGPEVKLTPEPLKKSSEAAEWAATLSEGAKVKSYKTVVLP